MENDIRSIKNIFIFFLVIVVLYICKSLSAIVVPLLLAFFIALLLYPLLKFFENKKIPTILSIFLTVVFPFPFIYLIIEAIRISVVRFYDNSEQ